MEEEDEPHRNEDEEGGPSGGVAGPAQDGAKTPTGGAYAPGVVPVAYFGTEEKVKMVPTVFMIMCDLFMLAPSIELFASRREHQLPRYFTGDEDDAQAMGRNAFACVWSPEVCLYANPPRSFTGEVLQKVKAGKSRVMLVTPCRVNAPWYEELKEMTVRSVSWEGILYISDGGRIRPRPKWITLFSYVVGS